MRWKVNERNKFIVLPGRNSFSIKFNSSHNNSTTIVLSITHFPTFHHFLPRRNNNINHTVKLFFARNRKQVWIKTLYFFIANSLTPSTNQPTTSCPFSCQLPFFLSATMNSPNNSIALLRRSCSRVFSTWRWMWWLNRYWTKKSRWMKSSDLLILFLFELYFLSVCRLIEFFATLPPLSCISSLSLLTSQ